MDAIKPNIRSRIIRHEMIPASELKANPKNWRQHPKFQKDALKGVLAEVGWVSATVVNERTGYMLDGHLRETIATDFGPDELVPVLYVDLSEEEENLILATLDPIGALATADKEKLRALAAGSTTESEAVAQLLMSLSPPATNQHDQAHPGSGLTQEEYLDRYENSVVRQVVLIYTPEEFREVTEMLDWLREDRAAENNTTALTGLLRETYEAREQ